MDKQPSFMFWLCLVYLLYLAQPIGWVWQGHLAVPALAGAALAIAAFVTLYVLLMRRVTRVGPLQRPLGETLALGALVAIAVGAVLGFGEAWLGLFVYTAVAAAFALPVRPAVVAVAGISCITLLAGLAAGVGWSTAGQMAGLCAALGVGMIGTARLVTVNSELRAARRELARLAVADERLRISRDLHDLLGHSLSLIAIKSQLAGRLLHASPDQAGAEVRQVEDIARASLDQVRQAVSGYRQPTLVHELESARDMLAAAGVACEIKNDWPPLPVATEAALSWALREGVTNVIRHSGARRCAIRICEGADTVELEIVDDGRGAPTNEVGSGLTGIAERVAQVGGSSKAAPQPGGGFRLTVSVPRAVA
jgi:two-component system sensor histidine kinase DesK